MKQTLKNIGRKYIAPIVIGIAAALPAYGQSDNFFNKDLSNRAEKFYKDKHNESLEEARKQFATAIEDGCFSLEEQNTIRYKLGHAIHYAKLSHMEISQDLSRLHALLEDNNLCFTSKTRKSLEEELSKQGFNVSVDSGQQGMYSAVAFGGLLILGIGAFIYFSIKKEKAAEARR